MSGFNTKERNNNGEYEITFYTESRQDFEKVQDLCRELIDHNKPVSTKGDLISRSALRKAFKNHPLCNDVWLQYSREIIDNAPSIEQEVYIDGEDYNFFIRGYKEGRKDFERPKGEWSDLSTDGRHIGWIACSVCGQEPPSESNLRTNFCPNCGADMKKGGATNDSQDK